MNPTTAAQISESPTLPSHNPRSTPRAAHGAAVLDVSLQELLFALLLLVVRSKKNTSYNNPVLKKRKEKKKTSEKVTHARMFVSGSDTRSTVQDAGGGHAERSGGGIE